LIDINLLPGSVKRSAKRGLPRLRRGGGENPLAKLRGLSVNRTLLIVAGLWVVGIAGLAYLHFPSTARKIAIENDIKLAQDDSVRTAQQLAQTNQLVEQEKVIGQKLQVIQGIDAGRFIWPHVMDEVSRALPAYVWITQLSDLGAAAELPSFKLEGFSGNYFALARYVEELELSPFLHQVRLIGSSQTQQNERTVLSFVIELAYEEPPPDVLQTVPVFGPGSATAAAGRE